MNQPRRQQQTSKLREEYQKEKQRKNKLVDEAAYAWVENNVILINEQIDRRTVKRLIDSISRFEEVFGPYKEKLPALGMQLDDAEKGLEKVITGRANEKKASDMLKRLSFLFSSFSSFFSRDLPVLLNSHLFTAPKSNPEVRLDVLQPKPGERYNPGAIRDALKHGLEPSKDDMKLLKKIYSSNMPLVDAAALASQMLQMSFNELQGLTQMGSVPMVDTPSAATPPPIPPEEELPQQEGVVPVSKESVVRTQKKELILEINQANMAKVADVIGQLENNFNIAGLEKVNASLKATVSKARKELASNQWLQGQAAKQLLSFYNLMDNLNQQWPQIKPLFADGQLDPNDTIDLKKLLQSATKDSVFGKLAKAVKLQTPHAPGLDPDSVVNGILAAVSADGGIQAVSALFDKSQAMPKTTTEGEPKLGGQTQPTQKTGQAAASTPTNKAVQAADTGVTQSSEPLGGKEKVFDNATMAKDIAGKTKMNPDVAGNVEAIMNLITKNGYKIVPVK